LLTDFNDLAQKEGLLAVARQIEVPLEKGLYNQEKAVSNQENLYSVTGRAL
jgi:hypothetical protein